MRISQIKTLNLKGVPNGIASLNQTSNVHLMTPVWYKTVQASVFPYLTSQGTQQYRRHLDSAMVADLGKRAQIGICIENKWCYLTKKPIYESSRSVKKSDIVKWAYAQKNTPVILEFNRHVSSKEGMSSNPWENNYTQQLRYVNTLNVPAPFNYSDLTKLVWWRVNALKAETGIMLVTYVDLEEYALLKQEFSRFQIFTTPGKDFPRVTKEDVLNSLDLLSTTGSFGGTLKDYVTRTLNSSQPEGDVLMYSKLRNLILMKQGLELNREEFLCTLEELSEIGVYLK